MHRVELVRSQRGGLSLADTICLLFVLAKMRLAIPGGTPQLSGGRMDGGGGGGGGGPGWSGLTGCYRGAAVNETHSAGLI